MILRTNLVLVLVAAGCGGVSDGDPRTPFAGSDVDPMPGTRSELAPIAAPVFPAPAGAVPMGTARAGLAAVLVGDRILAIGGSDGARLDAVESYDPQTQAWTALQPLAAPRAPVAAALSDGRVYVFGGQGCSTPAASAFDPVAGTWAAADAPSQGTLLSATLGPDAGIYALGGCGHGTTGPLGAVERYHASTGWQPRAPMPTPRLNFAAVTGPDGRLYAIGGFTVTGGSGPKQGAITAAVEAYDLQSDTWTRVADLPTPRAALAAVTGADGRVYAIGGHATGPLATVEAYDPASDAWTRVADLPTARSDLAAVVDAAGLIHAIGGTTVHAADVPGHALRTVEVYDPVTGWR